MKRFEHCRKKYGFQEGAHSCTYRIEAGEREILLQGEERNGGVLLSFEKLSFSPSEARIAESFVRDLAESRTYPRMMKELAEEYFSSADLE